MALVQDSTTGVWSDTPATGAGGVRLNDNFSLLTDILNHFVPNLGGQTKLTALNSFLFQNPTDDGSHPTFLIVQNAASSDFAQFYANDGTTLLIQLRADGAILNAHSFQAPDFWLNGARQNYHQDLAEAGPTIWDLNENDFATLTMTTSQTLAFLHPHVGKFTLRIIMAGSGSYSLTWPSEIIWPGAIPAVPTADVGAVDIVTFFSPDGTSFYPI